MPKISIPLGGTSVTVSRPVVFDIVKQVQAITNFGKEARIFFAGDMKSVSQNGTTIDDSNRESIISNGRFLTVDVEEDFDKEYLYTNAVHQIEHTPVFADQSIGLYIRPSYAQRQVAITFTYRTQSEVEVQKWYDSMRVALSILRDINLHKVTYSYEIPDVVLELIDDVSYLKEEINGYNEDIFGYFKRCASPRLRLISDSTGTNYSLVIAETQSRIEGLFDFDGIPDKPQKDPSTGNWTIAFTYKFNYEKPLSLVAKYPLMVHNQLLPPKYIDFLTQLPDHDTSMQRFTASLEALREFESQLEPKKYMDPVKPLAIPEFDDFVTANTLPGVGPVWTALCSIDLDDHKSLVSLRDLGDVVMDDDIIDFIKQSEYPYITKPYKSIFNIGLFINQRTIGGDYFECTPDLMIKSTETLDPRNNHRVRLNLTTDLAMLDQAAIERLLQYPKAFVKVIDGLNSILSNHPGIKALGNKTHITEYDFSAIYRFLTGVNYNNNKGTKTYYDTGYRVRKLTNPGNVNNNGVMISTGTNITGTLSTLDSSGGDTYHVLDPFKDIRSISLNDIKRMYMKQQTVMITGIIAYK